MCIRDRDYDALTCDLQKKTWVVNQQPPVLDTQTIENYLSKYICRTAVTPKRIHYDSATNMVELLHKNYNDQKTGEPAPLNITNLFLLDAIQMILQHKLHLASTKVDTMVSIPPPRQRK